MEAILKRYFLAAIACFSVVAFAQDGHVSEIPFDSVPNFLKLPPDLYLGEASGVAVNSKQHIFVFSRGNTTGPAYGATAAQILEFGPDGKYIREIGHNLYAWSFAHAIRFDKDDNLWAIDKGSDMIIKFNPEGRVTMVFGRKKEASDEGAEPWKHPNPPLPAINGQFRQPTDVTWDPQGNIFISDGYINSRVAKFDKNGDWVKQWGDSRQRAGRVQHAAQHRRRRQRQHLCGRSRQSPHPGVRSRRKFPARDHHRRAGPARRAACGWATPCPRPKHGRHGSAAARRGPSASRPGPTQYLYSADAYPGRIYKLSLDGKVLGVSGQHGPPTEAVRLDSRDGVPVGERNLRRRDPELARAEADCCIRASRRVMSLMVLCRRTEPRTPRDRVSTS